MPWVLNDGYYGSSRRRGRGGRSSNYYDPYAYHPHHSSSSSYSDSERRAAQIGAYSLHYSPLAARAERSTRQYEQVRQGFSDWTNNYMAEALERDREERRRWREQARRPGPYAGTYVDAPKYQNPNSYYEGRGRGYGPPYDYYEGAWHDGFGHDVINPPFYQRHADGVWSYSFPGRRD